MKAFSLKQLFSVVDGRLSDKMGDVYEIFNTVAGRDVFTHELPVIWDFVEELAPTWFLYSKEIIDKIRLQCDDDFETIMVYFDNHEELEKITVSELTELQKKELKEYLHKNNLFTRYKKPVVQVNTTQLV